MDNATPDLPEPEKEPSPEPIPQPEPVVKTKADPLSETGTKIIEGVKDGAEKAKVLINDGKDYYRKSPRLQKVVYQGKFFPAFWTVACIFSLLVNIILVGLLVSFGHHFFALKALVSDGLVTEASNNLAMMDQAHIVINVPVETTVRLQDNLPVVFDLPINQSTQLLLAEESNIKGARIYLNNTAVTTDLTLPASTPLQANFDMTIPISTSVPVDITVPVSVQVPVDIAIDKTDLHQSIVGLQEALAPYKTTLGTTFNSPQELAICKNWLTGWLCRLVFGQ
jgi:hypothetical protein